VRRTKDLNIGLLASIAAATLAMSGCGSPVGVRRCVDQNLKVVADDNCEDRDRAGPVTIGGVYPYRWYYGGSSGYIPPGGVVGEGSFASPEGVSTFAQPTSGKTVYGVFGGSAHGEAAGE
jgi:hypothetical protein